MLKDPCAFGHLAPAKVAEEHGQHKRHFTTSVWAAKGPVPITARVPSRAPPTTLLLPVPQDQPLDKEMTSEAHAQEAAHFRQLLYFKHATIRVNTTLNIDRKRAQDAKATD